MTMSTTTVVTAKHDGGCGGDGCGARDAWPLHHVRHGGIYCRLCTSCVLKYHPGSFCTLCFDLIDAISQAKTPASPEHVLVHCSQCASVAHLDCLLDPHLASQFVCPRCKNPERYSYFPKENLSDGKMKIIDEKSAKVLVAAANLSLNSLRRAAAVARAAAEKKVKEAATAKKRGREMLERSLVICKMENERANMRNAASVAAPDALTPKPTATLKPLAANPNPKQALTAEELRKRKWGKVGTGDGEREQREQKKPHSSTIDRWMMFYEPIPGMRVLRDGEKDKLKVENRVPVCLRQDAKEKRGNLLSTQSAGGVNEDARSLVGSGEKGPRLPQPTQDVLVSRTNPRSIFTGSPSTASLHS